MIQIGGNFGGIDAGYTQCLVEVPQTQVDPAKVYTAQLSIRVVNNVHVITVSNVAAK